MGAMPFENTLFEIDVRAGLADGEAPLFEAPPERLSAAGTSFFHPLLNCPLPERSDVRPRRFDFFCLLQATSGAGWYWSKSLGRTPVSAFQCVLVCPQTVHDFAAAKGGMNIDRICFCGSMPELLRAQGVMSDGLADGIFSRRLPSLISHCSDVSQEGALKAFSELAVLLTDLHLASANKGRRSKVGALLEEIKRKPEAWWDCQRMAAFCNLSEVHFRRVFAQETGMPPKLYLDQAKMDKAAELLKNGFSANQIASLLGYADQFHFSRRFKAIKGVSPRNFLLGLAKGQ